MTLVEFNEVFLPIIEYYKADLSKSTIALYFDLLKEFSQEQFLLARKKIFQTRKYTNMPTIADFVEAIQGSIDTQALKAFERLEKTMTKYGQYNSVCFKDKTIMRVVDNMGGWVEIFNVPNSEWKWFEKEFIAKYKAFYNQGYFKTHLAGYVEKQNSYNGNGGLDIVYFVGFDDKKPMLLKDFVKTQNRIVNQNFKKLLEQKRINNAS